eukprot:3323265-Prymnesium_polylepis.1
MRSSGGVAGWWAGGRGGRGTWNTSSAQGKRGTWPLPCSCWYLPALGVLRGMEGCIAVDSRALHSSVVSSFNPEPARHTQ